MLEQQVAVRNDIIQRVKLYELAFDGPSPGSPEEDAKEGEVKEAEACFNEVTI